MATGGLVIRVEENNQYVDVVVEETFHLRKVVPVDQLVLLDSDLTLPDDLVELQQAINDQEGVVHFEPRGSEFVGSESQRQVAPPRPGAVNGAAAGEDGEQNSLTRPGVILGN